MFEYFPGNYVWNLTVVAALNSGGLIDEVDRACRPLREIATKGSDPGTAEFLRAWTVVVVRPEACVDVIFAAFSAVSVVVVTALSCVVVSACA